MRTVTITQSFPVTVSDAERRWFDTSHWYHWVDGLEQVLKVDPGWPDPGAAVSWQSNPAGRGRVTERSIVRDPLSGQTSEVEDDSIRGRQSVEFAPVDAGVEVTLTLEYEIKRRNPFTPVIDWLFIRGAMATSLQTTMSRFGAELHTARTTDPS